MQPYPNRQKRDSEPPLERSIPERIQELRDSVSHKRDVANIIRHNLIRTRYPSERLDEEIGRFLGQSGRYTGWIPDAVRMKEVLIPGWYLDQVNPVGDRYSVVFRHDDGRERVGLKVTTNPAQSMAALSFVIYVEDLTSYLESLSGISGKYAAAMRGLVDCQNDLLDLETKKPNFVVDRT